MRKLLWPVRIGLVTLALVFMPAEAGDGRLSGAALCAAESDESDACKVEVGSYCVFEGTLIADMTNKASP